MRKSLLELMSDDAATAVIDQAGEAGVAIPEGLPKWVIGLAERIAEYEMAALIFWLRDNSTEICVSARIAEPPGEYGAILPSHVNTLANMLEI